MRFVFIIALTFILSGCVAKSSKFVFPSQPVNALAQTNVQIGVKEIEIPNYLNSDKIIVKNGAQIKQIDAKFADVPNKMLTQKAIEGFKSALNDPNVFIYPWDIKSKKGYIVEIKLDKFLYENQEAVIAGSYYLKNASGTTIVAKNFRKSMPCAKDANSIVTKLSTLFSNLVVEIAEKIAR